MKREEKRKRLETANAIIRIIASHGRRFFSMSEDRRTPLPDDQERISYFFIGKSGHIYLQDRYTQKPIYTHYQGRWYNFSEGGTLKRVVVMLRDYISGHRESIEMRLFGPWPEWICGGDLWGYGADMEIVRSEIVAVIKAASA